MEQLKEEIETIKGTLDSLIALLEEKDTIIQGLRDQLEESEQREIEREAKIKEWLSIADRFMGKDQ